MTEGLETALSGIRLDSKLWRIGHAITFPAHQLYFNLGIVAVTAIFAVIERIIHHALEDLRRELEYHIVTNWNEVQLDGGFTQLQILLGGSTTGMCGNRRGRKATLTPT